VRWSIGSTWLRWDPHIHAPGTLKENQYGDHGDPAVWDRYFARIREARPACAAIGITDYFVPRGYRLFVERGGPAQLPGIHVFPNVELRLKTRTDKGHAFNVHLLVSPDAPDLLATLTSKLAALTFRYDDNDYRCTEEDLRRLGRVVARDPSLADEGALRAGAAQFLVNDEHFATLKREAWIREHVLFAVAAGNDGLSGLKGDAFKSFREELARIADVVLSGSPSERRYWLGEHPDVEHRISGVKPCLHGSDAHGFDRILAPDDERRCWIRASATFDGLRQTLLDPRRRVHVGPFPDDARSQSNVIRTMRVRNATCFTPSEFSFNDGLVTIIGARGSGKTALADLIALAADARDSEPSTASFVQRAADQLVGVEVELDWADGTTSPARAVSGQANEHPRVRYLSQQFVERLSQRDRRASWQNEQWSDDDGSRPQDPLLEEIERVVFEAIPVEDRMETDSFASLRDARLGEHLETRNAARDLISRKTETIAAENAKRRVVGALKTARDEATRAREAIELELKSLPATAPTEHVKAYEDALGEHKRLQDAIQKQAVRAQRLQALRSALEQHQARSDEEHDKLRIRYADLSLDPAGWEELRPKVDVAALDSLGALADAARDDETKLRERGTTQQLPADAPAAGIAALAGRVAAAQKTLGEDDTNSKRRAELVKKLDGARTREEKATKEHADAESAAHRITGARDARFEAYERLLRTLDAEVATLNHLYEPLKRRLAADERLRLLTFEVSRDVNLGAWVAAGERLFDFRRAPLRGRGELLDAARRVLEPAWRGGTAAAVRAAIEKFQNDYLSDPASVLRQGATMLELGQWLFSTDHISIRYGIRYEDRDLAHLSPGTRGVVLLTLFLAIDDHDERPLVIDQPEENLDPKSIDGLLRPFFVEAARRRQIIMVTHNANLVVNTDADQVIVATSARSDASPLPNFRYEAGGLEDSRIRTLVCQYLEGGEEAFRRRAARYGEIVRRPRTTP
jgi:energy-coupling factor transporter ATP-binding protein EcfA2